MTDVPEAGSPAEARADELAAPADEMNRSRFARSGLSREKRTRGEVELDDIHLMLKRQWYLLVTMSCLVLVNSANTVLALGGVFG